MKKIILVIVLIGKVFYANAQDSNILISLACHFRNYYMCGKKNCNLNFGKKYSHQLSFHKFHNNNF